MLDKILSSKCFTSFIYWSAMDFMRDMKMGVTGPSHQLIATRVTSLR